MRGLRALCNMTWVILASILVGLLVQLTKKCLMFTRKSELSVRAAIVTGGNSGIGYESALGLTRQNVRVVIACRNEEKAKTAVKNMKAESGENAIDYMIVDFAEVASIKRAVDEFMEKEERLDILVNNAGTVSPGKTKDGLDMMFGVNHIGYFMFTNLLMPLMRKTSKINPVRIINVASGAYESGKIDLNNLSPDITEDSGLEEVIKQYSNTKLMNIYFTRELDARLKKEFKGQDQAITTYSIHPGVVQTNLRMQFLQKCKTSSQYFYELLSSDITVPVAAAAETTLYCCLKEGIEEHSGGFFDNLQHVQLMDHALNAAIGKKLWNISEEICGVNWENSNCVI